VYPVEVKIADVIKLNYMMLDLILEENDRFIICGSVNVLDHENNTLAHMMQMTPSVMKKMATVFQVTFVDPTRTINYPRECYILKCTSTCIESFSQIRSRSTYRADRRIARRYRQLSVVHMQTPRYQSKPRSRI
jgi:hypothetical protein